MATTYNWSSAFDSRKAIEGESIGIKIAGNDGDLSYMGEVKQAYPDGTLKVSIRGNDVICSSSGVITSSPADASLVNKQLLNLSAIIDHPTTIEQTRSSEGTAKMTSTTPRDEFAMQVLNAIIHHTEDAQDLDDATMLKSATYAYRWAQAMMQAAADYRKSDTDTNPDPSTDIAEAIDKMVIRNAQTTGTNPVDIPLKTSLVDGSNNILGTSTNKLQVNVTGGGGGGGGSVDLDDLLNGLGYDKTATPGTGVTQADKMDELIAAVTNSGQLKKANVAELTSSPIQAAYNSLDYFLVYSEFNGIYPYKLSRSNFDRLYGLLPSSQTTFPAAPEYGYYYKVSTAVGSSLTINLGSYTFLVGAVRIFIARFTVGSSACALSFTVNGDTPAAGAVKWRGTKLTSLDADTEYEMDFVANGSCWTVGATKIVS